MLGDYWWWHLTLAFEIVALWKRKHRHFAKLSQRWRQGPTAVESWQEGVLKLSTGNSLHVYRKKLNALNIFNIIKYTKPVVLMTYLISSDIYLGIHNMHNDNGCEYETWTLKCLSTHLYCHLAAEALATGDGVSAQKWEDRKSDYSSSAKWGAWLKAWWCIRNKESTSWKYLQCQ